MNIQPKHFFYALLSAGIIALALACEPKCAYCYPGAECVDGKCQCQSDRYYYFGECRELMPNTYLGITEDCYCYDTILFDIRKVGEKYHFRFQGIDHIFFDSVVFDDGEILYFERPDGDSLLVPFLFQKCLYTDPDVIYMRPRIYGKKQPDGAWKLYLKFFRTNYSGPAIDSCTVIARKIN